MTTCPQAPSPEPVAAESDNFLGRYRILSLIGRGAMGVVYLAHDEQLDRRVAIKTVRSDALSNPVERDRLCELIAREGRIAAKLSHPGIVQAFDVLSLGRTPMVVFEYIDGPLLAEYLKENEDLDTVEESTGIFLQILDAVAYAHGQSVVHCDLKPGNILVTRQGAVKIADFGVAQVLSDTRFALDLVGGSPQYMSPEQIRREPLSPASDVFALGVLGYELFTGQSPFPGPDANTLFGNICGEPPIQLRSIRNDLSVELESVLLRALNKRPSERYASASEMRQAMAAAPEAARLVDPLAPSGERARAAPASPSERQPVEKRFPKVPPVAVADGGLDRYSIPDLSVASREILQLAHEPLDSLDISRLVQIVERDPAISARVLRVANSPLYGRAREIASLRQAVTLIGLREVMSLLHYYTLKTMFADFPPTDGFTLEGFWKHCWVCALAAHDLGRPDLLVGAKPGELYLAGLLHDIGKLIIARHHPDEFHRCLRLARQSGVPLCAAEREILGLDHAYLGRRVLSRWNIPEPILDAVEYHHEPGEASPERRELASLTEYANALANISGVGYSGNRSGYRLAECQFSREKLAQADATSLEQRILLQVLENVWRKEGMVDQSQREDPSRGAEGRLPAAPQQKQSPGILKRIAAWFRT